MKKRIVLSGFILAAALGLTACGNPLKSLPEVSDTNLVDLVDEDKEANDAAARIIKELDKNDSIIGEIESVVVYERDDDEKEKNKSEVSVEVVTTTDYAEYTYYYVVEMKYDKEEKYWKVKDSEPDKHEDMSIDIKTDAKAEKLIQDLVDYSYSIYAYYEDDSYNYEYFYPDSEDMFDNFKVGDCTVTEIVENQYYEIAYDVSFTISNGFKYFDVEGQMYYEYAAPSYYGYEYYGYDYIDLIIKDTYLDPELEEVLSGEKMLQGAIDSGYITMGYYYYDFDAPITKDMITSVEYGDIIFYSSSCCRPIYVTIEGAEGFAYYYELDVYYGFYNNEWSYDDCYVYTDYDRSPTGYSCCINDNVLGTYTGSVYKNKETTVGTVEMVITSYNDYYVYGTFKYAPEGTSLDDVEPIEFEGTYYTSYYEIDLYLDDSFKIDKNSVSYMYLYYDYNDLKWKTSSSSTYTWDLDKQ